jgi:hypothetical protein
MILFARILDVVLTVTVSNFSPEDGNSIFIRNVGIYLRGQKPPHRKNNTDIVTAMRTSNLKSYV